MARKEEELDRLKRVLGEPNLMPHAYNHFGKPDIVEDEFPPGGDPEFRKVLSAMLKLHISKSNDYGTGADPYANYSAAEQIGVPAWKSCFIRGLEKIQRIANAASGKKLNHESAENSFLDLANHVVIAYILYQRNDNGD